MGRGMGRDWEQPTFNSSHLDATENCGSVVPAIQLLFCSKLHMGLDGIAYSQLCETWVTSMGGAICHVWNNKLTPQFILLYSGHVLLSATDTLRVHNVHISIPLLWNESLRNVLWGTLGERQPKTQPVPSSWFVLEVKPVGGSTSSTIGRSNLLKGVDDSVCNWRLRLHSAQLLYTLSGEGKATI